MNKFIFTALMLFGAVTTTAGPILDFGTPQGVTGDATMVTHRVVGKISAIGDPFVPVARNNCKDHLNSPDNPLVRWPITVSYGELRIPTCYYATRPNVKGPEIGDRFELIIKSYIWPGAQID